MECGGRGEAGTRQIGTHLGGSDGYLRTDDDLGGNLMTIFRIVSCVTFRIVSCVTFSHNPGFATIRIGSNHGCIFGF